MVRDRLFGQDSRATSNTMPSHARMTATLNANAILCLLDLVAAKGEGR